MTDTTTIVTEPKKKRALFTLRAVGAFLLLAALVALLYWWGYNAYLPVAEWSEPGSHEALIYEDATYYRAGMIGKKGLTKARYPMDKVLGQVKDDGVPVLTEAATLPPDAEEGETLKVTPPNGDPTLARDSAYVLYSVKDKENFLIVLETDGEYYLYYHESIENPVVSG